MDRLEPRASNPAHAIGGGSSETLMVGWGTCALGAVFVAQGPRGLRTILLGDDPDALLCDGRSRFPEARLESGGLETVLSEVLTFIDDPRRELGLALDPRGTDFQLRVWRELGQIPFGETTSYQALASRLGRPTAFRAVAQACGANPLAVAIPCHRVLKSDGGLSGYRWGLERKRALLDREQGSIGALRLGI
ncbi:MAG: methylated-DNA--[protein]-cysteine S-methyltransferase [Myxococcota bacterium]